MSNWINVKRSCKNSLTPTDSDYSWRVFNNKSFWTHFFSRNPLSYRTHSVCLCFTLTTPTGRESETSSPQPSAAPNWGWWVPLLVFGWGISLSLPIHIGHMIMVGGWYACGINVHATLQMVLSIWAHVIVKIMILCATIKIVSRLFWSPGQVNDRNVVVNLKGRIFWGFSNSSTPYHNWGKPRSTVKVRFRESSNHVIVKRMILWAAIWLDDRSLGLSLRMNIFLHTHLKWWNGYYLSEQLNS